MIETAALLREDGRSEDADWVQSLTRQVFPELASFIEQKLKEKSASHVAQSEEVPPVEESPRVPERIPFPTFV